MPKSASLMDIMLTQIEGGPAGDAGPPGPPGTTDYDELSNKPTLGTAAAEDIDAFATAAQGATADSAVQTESDPIAVAALTTHAGLTTSAHGGVVASNDARLTDARTPLAHAHPPGDITGTAVVTADSRLSDARTPTAHKTSHENGGSDEISAAGLSGVLADPQPPIIGGGATQAVAGNDSRLTDARTPTAHSHVAADITGTAVLTADARLSDARTPTAHKTSHQDGGSDELSVAGLSGVLADPQPPIIGSGATQSVAGNDARLTDDRSPTAHKTSHQDGGADEISVAGLSGLLADPQTPATHTHDLTGHVTSVGNATVLGSFTLAQLSTAVSDANIARIDAGNTFTGHQTMEGVTATGATGTGNQVYSISPTFTGIVLGAKIALTAADDAGSAPFTVNLTGSSGGLPLGLFQASQTNGTRVYFAVGRAWSAGNSAYVGFSPNATAASNRLILGFYGADDLFNFFQSGGMAIGSTTDPGANNLSVTGTVTGSNLSGTNTGDNATNTQYSGLVASKQDTLVSATNIKTINGSSVLGSGDLVVSGAAADLALTLIAPAVDETVTAGYSGYVSDYYEVASTKFLEVGDGAVMEVG